MLFRSVTSLGSQQRGGGGFSFANLPPPMVKEGATVKLAAHSYVIPDGNVVLVPNVGIVVGTRGTLVIDPGLGRRNGEAILREVVLAVRAGSLTEASIRAARSGKGDPKALLETARRSARVGKNLFAWVHKKTARALTMNEGIRLDGRKVDEIQIGRAHV